MISTIIGASLIATPFVLVTWLMVYESGWAAAAKTWLVTMTVVACIAAGVFLL